MTEDPDIVARTPRLRLRHFVAEDIQSMAPMLGDPEVMRFSDGLMDRNAARRWLAMQIEGNYPDLGFGHWAVVETVSGMVIGYCGLDRLPGRCGTDEAELGYRLARRWWGRGLATEAARAVRDHGLGALGLRRLIAIVDPGNPASIRVLEKIGMTFEREISFPGYDHPDHLYAMC